jgi:hypothetical protein
MSKRRKIGDVVMKRAGAGFGGHACLCEIPDVEGNRTDRWKPERCRKCDDPDCRNWPTLWGLREDGQTHSWTFCHVCECEMDDAPPAASYPIREADLEELEALIGLAALPRTGAPEGDAKMRRAQSILANVRSGYGAAGEGER